MPLSTSGSPTASVTSRQKASSSTSPPSSPRAVCGTSTSGSPSRTATGSPMSGCTRSSTPCSPRFSATTCRPSPSGSRCTSSTYGVPDNPVERRGGSDGDDRRLRRRHDRVVGCDDAGKDGHQVTALETDSESVPVTPGAAWASWRRKGVGPFRQPHNLFARFRRVCEEELPALTERLLAAGCAWVDPLESLPPGISDLAPRPGDEALRFVTGRRPVTESAIAAAAQEQPRLVIRRGV